MAQRAPSEELQRRWLDAVLLPGIRDPRESCLTELSEYSGRSREEVLALCERSRDLLKDRWDERPRDSAEAIDDFYRDADAYIYGLLWWHCLQKGPAVAWSARILELALERDVRSCLDFGGGIGSNALLFQRAGIDTTLAEISRPSLDFARSRAERRGLELRFIDLNCQSLDGRSFDLVTAIDVLEHVPDHLDTLERLTALVRPGGYLCFDLIAGRHDPDEPFHLMGSKYPIRSRIRGMGLAPVARFGKYLFLCKVTRSELANRWIRGWDVLRWRLYYLAQGQWPSAR
jgi:2-polyprenyl-3-methyl-5-hydroxy-6-metoxy-1,4-benzoquinol methylase